MTSQTSYSKKSAKLLLLALVLFGGANFSHGQNQILIQGMVADSATFKPMADVNIVVKNKLRGSQSDQKGNFKLFATVNDTLLLSFVGYKTKEMPLYDWEAGIILMAEDPLILESVTFEGFRLNEPSFYEEIFKDQNAIWEKRNKKLPFYYSKQKKETKKISRLENENTRVQTYVDVVFNHDLKEVLMKKYNLDERTYYDLMTRFNEQNHRVMYYLSASELLSLIYRFYETNAGR